MIAHSSIPEILSILAPKTKITPSIVKEFSEKLFDNLSKNTFIAGIENELDEKYKNLRKQFSKSVSKLSNHEMTVLADAISGLLSLRHQFGFERSCIQ